MKSTTLTLLLSFAAHILLAQNGQDTTVYNIADAMPYPLLRSCDPSLHPGWNSDSIRRCAETQFFRILAANIRYPADAHDRELQGTVVVTCIIEPQTGKMSQLALLKDIGGGCGEEAIRVLSALEEAGLRWQPGMLNGKPVRVRHALPIKFRLEEALPYYVSTEGDTIYTQYEKGPEFKGGVDSLVSFVINQLTYPAAWKDSCKTGIIEMAVVIRPNGSIHVSNQLDFSNLGLDFQFEALRLARRTNGMWTPAQFSEKNVSTNLPLRMVFKSDEAGCATANAQFDRAMILADEGAALMDQNKADEAIRKWDEALILQPNNCELLYYRGSAHMNIDHQEEACKDFQRVKELLGITWFEDIRRLLCGN